ncbi:MAG: hypothetical protein K2N01_00290 [Lachnospiraceae bacterium]|nr:hypothetical protein [Lachnospiraceae bacterium]
MNTEEIRKNMHRLEELQSDLRHITHEVQSEEEQRERDEAWYRFQLEGQMYYAERMPFLKSGLEEQNALIQEADRSYHRMQDEIRRHLQQKQEACEEEQEDYAKELRESKKAEDGK